MDVFDLQARFRSQLVERDLATAIRAHAGPVKLYLSMCSPEYPPAAEIHGQDLDCLLVMPYSEGEPIPVRGLRLDVGGLPHILSMDDAITTLRDWIADNGLRLWDYRYQDIGGQLDYTAWVGGDRYPPHLLPAPKPRTDDHRPRPAG